MAERFRIKDDRGNDIRIYGHPRWQEIKTGYPDWAPEGHDYVVEGGTRIFMENFQTLPKSSPIVRGILEATKGSSLWSNRGREYMPINISWGISSDSFFSGCIVALSSDGESALVWRYGT